MRQQLTLAQIKRTVKLITEQRNMYENLETLFLVAHLDANTFCQ